MRDTVNGRLVVIPAGKPLTGHTEETGRLLRLRRTAEAVGLAIAAWTPPQTSMTGRSSRGE